MKTQIRTTDHCRAAKIHGSDFRADIPSVKELIVVTQGTMYVFRFAEIARTQYSDITFPVLIVKPLVSVEKLYETLNMKFLRKE